MGAPFGKCGSFPAEDCLPLQPFETCGSREPWMGTARGLCSRLIVLDFEFTLTSEGIDNNHDGEMLRYFGGQKRVDQLRHFLTELEARGVGKVIVSWKSQALIIMALEAVGLLQLIDHICDRKILQRHGCTDHVPHEAFVINDILAKLGAGLVRSVYVHKSLSKKGSVTCEQHLVLGDHGITSIDMDALQFFLQIPERTFLQAAIVEEFDT